MSEHIKPDYHGSEVTPKLKGKLAETLPNERLRGSLARKSMSDTINIANHESSELRGKGLQIGQEKEPKAQVYASLKNGKRYAVIEYVDRSDRGWSTIVRLQCLDDMSTINLHADALLDSDRFKPIEE